MSGKKKERFAPVQFTWFSFVCLFFCWVAVTGLAFLAGYGLGNTKRVRAAADRWPVFERSGGVPPSVGLTFPHILGTAETDPHSPEGMPGGAALAQDTLRSVPSASETEKARAVAASVAGLHDGPDGPRSDAPGTQTAAERVLQVASFRDPTKAEGLAGVLTQQGYRAFTGGSTHPHSGEPLYRVFVGPFPTVEDAQKAKASLESGGGFRGILIRTGPP